MIDKELIKTYKDCEDIVTSNKAQLLERQEEFNTSNEMIISQIEVNQSNMRRIQEQLKEQGLEEYKETGNKTLTGGLRIQERTKYDYKESDAINWAKTEMPVAIVEKLNDKMFKAHIKKNDLDFVTKEKKTIATFPSELKLEVN